MEYGIHYWLQHHRGGESRCGGETCPEESVYCEYSNLRSDVEVDSFVPQGDAMNDETAGRVHWSFWAIGAVALVWNVMGVINFFAQMNADALASFPESHRAIVVGRPAWATGALALAVFGGRLVCFLLLLRKPAASYCFFPSLLGVFVRLIHTLGIANSKIDFIPFKIHMIIQLHMD